MEKDMKSRLKVACPHCKQWLFMQKPQQEGTYKLKCPKCVSSFGVKVTASMLSQPKQVVPVESDSRKVIMKVTCSHCKQPLKLQKPDKDGVYKYTCPKCGKVFAVKLVNSGQEQPPSADTKEVKAKDIKLSKGILRQLRMLRPDCRFELKEGDNIIGRKDNELKSDIQIEGDAAISRRSIQISVLKSERGYLFKLTVLKATNKVFHNAKPLLEGERVYLNYGDTLVLGKTHFVFDKAK